jgi:hypothetical protein
VMWCRRYQSPRPTMRAQHMDRYHVVAGGYLRWLVCDRERDDQVVAAERSYELAQDKADELNEEARGAEERA